jgi:hypothetical protein
MKATPRIARVLGCGLALLWSAHARAAADTWTPDRVRTFVLQVEREMNNLMVEQGKTAAPPPGICHGAEVVHAIKKSEALPRLRNLITGKVVDCYVTTYLGCSNGDWLGRSFASEYGPQMVPYTLSKVTIVTQTADRVVADVVEASSDEVSDGFLWDEGFTRHLTEKEIRVKDSSRYTISRGKDGVWRISDRKPPFQWYCDPNYVRTDYP